jgi:hypothetical protein
MNRQAPPAIKQISPANAVEAELALGSLKTGPAKPVAFIAALLLFTAVNVVLYIFHNHYQPTIEQACLNSSPNAASHTKEWTWWLARKWLEQKTPPDVVLFGSSQMGSAICAADAQHELKVVDALLHRRVTSLESNLASRLGRPVSVFTLATPGAMCSDAYMASKALFTNDFHPKVVILGVAPRDFIDASLPYAASTEPFRFYSRFVSPGTKLTLDAYHSPLAWLQYAVDALPFKKLGMFVQGALAEGPAEKLDDGGTDTASGTPLAAVLGAGPAERGKWLVPANIPDDLWTDNTKEYKHRFANPGTPVYDAEKQFFNAFLSNMQARGITVVVVGMPSLPMNRQLLSNKFWAQFRSTLSKSCSLHNAQFLDLTDSPLFVKADYLDTVHLNAKGGAKLFNTLGAYAAADPLVTAQLNTPSVAAQSPHSVAVGETK